MAAGTAGGERFSATQRTLEAGEGGEDDGAFARLVAVVE
jgi:hypothetical protein